jgi:hypothetical protein
VWFRNSVYQTIIQSTRLYFHYKNNIHFYSSLRISPTHMAIYLPATSCTIFAWWWPLGHYQANFNSRYSFYNKRTFVCWLNYFWYIIVSNFMTVWPRRNSKLSPAESKSNHYHLSHAGGLVYVVKVTFFLISRHWKQRWRSLELKVKQRLYNTTHIELKLCWEILVWANLPLKYKCVLCMAPNTHIEN